MTDPSVNRLLADILSELQHIRGQMDNLPRCFIPLAFEEGDRVWRQGTCYEWQDYYWRKVEGDAP